MVLSWMSCIYMTESGRVQVRGLGCPQATALSIGPLLTHPNPDMQKYFFFLFNFLLVAFMTWLASL